MAKYYNEPSRTFSEYLLIPGYSGPDNIPEKVDLKEELKSDSSKISYNVPDKTKEPEDSKKGFFSKRKKR